MTKAGKSTGEEGGQRSPFGAQLRYWRTARCLSQLDLASKAQSTTRYISFLENGRSRPSEQMVHRLADALNVPVRERNQLLELAGFAGSYAIRGLTDAELAPYMQAVRFAMDSHNPFPALAVNRWGDVLDANESAKRFLGQLQPEGVRPNFTEWLFEADSSSVAAFENWSAVAWGTLRRLRRELVLVPRDERLNQLVSMAEKRLVGEPITEDAMNDHVVCPNVRIGGRLVRLVGMVARFGLAQDQTLDEIRVEMGFPRDAESEAYFRELAEQYGLAQPRSMFAAPSSASPRPFQAPMLTQ